MPLTVAPPPGHGDAARVHWLPAHRRSPRPTPRRCRRRPESEPALPPAGRHSPARWRPASSSPAAALGCLRLADADDCLRLRSSPRLRPSLAAMLLSGDGRMTPRCAVGALLGLRRRIAATLAVPAPLVARARRRSRWRRSSSHRLAALATRSRRRRGRHRRRPRVGSDHPPPERPPGPWPEAAGAARRRGWPSDRRRRGRRDPPDQARRRGSASSRAERARGDARRAPAGFVHRRGRGRVGRSRRRARGRAGRPRRGCRGLTDRSRRQGRARRPRCGHRGLADRPRRQGRARRPRPGRRRRPRLPTRKPRPPRVPRTHPPVPTPSRARRPRSGPRPRPPIPTPSSRLRTPQHRRHARRSRDAPPPRRIPRTSCATTTTLNDKRFADAWASLSPAVQGAFGLRALAGRLAPDALEHARERVKVRQGTMVTARARRARPRLPRAPRSASAGASSRRRTWTVAGALRERARRGHLPCLNVDVDRHCGHTARAAARASCVAPTRGSVLGRCSPSAVRGHARYISDPRLTALILKIADVSSLDAHPFRLCVSRSRGIPHERAPGWGVRCVPFSRLTGTGPCHDVPGFVRMPGRHPACTRPLRAAAASRRRVSVRRSPLLAAPAGPPQAPGCAPAHGPSRPRTATRRAAASSASSTPNARAAGCEPLRRDARARPSRPRALGRHGAPRLLRPRQPQRRDAQGPGARRRLRGTRARAGARARTSDGAPAFARPRTRSSTRGSTAPRTAGSCSGATIASSGSASPAAHRTKATLPGATYTMDVGRSARRYRVSDEG